MKIIEIKNKLGEIIIPKKWEPIGKILTFDREMEMSKYYYGTWELTLKERSPIGINPSSAEDRFKTAGNQFGEKEHTLTIAEMPRHKPPLDNNCGWALGFKKDSSESNIKASYSWEAGEWAPTSPDYIGGDQPHNNIHPVEVVYFYKRVA